MEARTQASSWASGLEIRTEEAARSPPATCRSSSRQARTLRYREAQRQVSTACKCRTSRISWDLLRSLLSFHIRKSSNTEHTALLTLQTFQPLLPFQPSGVPLFRTAAVS